MNCLWRKITPLCWICNRPLFFFFFLLPFFFPPPLLAVLKSPGLKVSTCWFQHRRRCDAFGALCVLFFSPVSSFIPSCVVIHCSFIMLFILFLLLLSEWWTYPADVCCDIEMFHHFLIFLVLTLVFFFFLLFCFRISCIFNGTEQNKLCYFFCMTLSLLCAAQSGKISKPLSMICAWWSPALPRSRGWIAMHFANVCNRHKAKFLSIKQGKSSVMAVF